MHIIWLGIDTMTQNMNNLMHNVNSIEFDNAVSTCSFISSNIVSFLKNYKYVNEISYSNKGYHFKLMHTSSHNGIHVFIPPYNNTVIELYYIFNNKRDVNNCIHINTNSYLVDIIYHMKKCMFNVKTQLDEIQSVYKDFSGIISNLSNKYNVKINNYNFNIIENETNNGYNFSINLSTKNYICIKIIQNGSYYDNANNVFYANSFDEAEKFLTESINENKHNKIVKYYKVIDTRFINDNIQQTRDMFSRLLSPPGDESNIDPS